MSSNGNLIVISAPSGSGKTSLANRLLAELEGVRFSVSYTTRPKRRGEKNGVEYYFVTQARFEEMIKADEFLEHAHVYENYYGTGRNFVLREMQSGCDVLLDIDVQGAMKVKKKLPEAVMVFVLPPSFYVLRQRLIKRGLDDPRVIEKRLKIARQEIQHYKDYEYVIINEDISRSVKELKSIVLASRCKVERRAREAKEIVATFGS